MIPFNILIFGDIFKFNEKEYIFLAKSEEIVYAAQVLSIEHTQRLNNFFQQQIIKNKITILTDKPLYCFVILKTKDFEGRAASLHDSGKDEFSIDFRKLPITLDLDDLKALRDEILKSRGVPLELKDLVKDLDI